jgi:hypothetical protein
MFMYPREAFRQLRLYAANASISLGRPILLILGLFLAIALQAVAQYDSASVLGTLHDHSGAALGKGSVVLTNKATGIQQTQLSNEEGNFEFGSVKPGDYTLSAERDGFKTARTDTFTVTVGARQRVDLVLEVGGATDTVTVSGAAEVLETDSSDRGEVVGPQEMVGLPLNGRSYADLALLVPGVRKSYLETQTLSSRDSSFNANGQRSEMNNFILDGLDNNLYGTDNQGFSNQTIQPSPDAISEFKVVTDNYSAEYGRVIGAVVNATTRSGTSQFHGDAWEYVRNTSLNAIGPFSAPTNTLTGKPQKPTYQQNQFGATFGGPLVAPFLRKKQFFFIDYEGERRITRSLATATIPDANQRQGYFSVAVMNPITGVTYPANTQVPIPANSLASLVLQNLPQPNVNANVEGASNNYVSLPRGSLQDDKGDIRYDANITPKLNAFARLSVRNVNIFDPPNIPGVDGGNSNSVVTIYDEQVASGVTYARTNNTLIDARIAFTWMNGEKTPPYIGQTSMLAEAGIPNIPTDPRVVGPLNTQAVNNFSNFGRQTTSPNMQNPYVIDPKVNYTWLHGRHSFKFGYEYQYIIVADDDFHPKYGNDVYSGNFSKPSGGVSSAAANEAYGLTDFIFGARSHYELNNTHIANIEQWLHQWYAQDDWRVNSKLTLNLGLRYELGSPEYEQNNELANFDPNTSPTTGQLVSASSGSLYNRALVNIQTDNWAPRVGFAYQALTNTVVRGGYGISYFHFVREGGENLLVYNPPFTFDAQINQVAPTAATNAQSLCPTNTGSNVFSPGSCFNTTMNGYVSGFTTAADYNPLNAQPHYEPKNDPTGYSQSWHLTVQRQLTRNTVLDIAYVGVKSDDIPVLADYNEAAANTTACTTNPNDCQTVEARRPIQTFAGIEANFGGGHGIYHALQAKLEHRYDSGLYLLNSFTYSHGIDNASGTLENNNGDTNFVNFKNPNMDRGRSGYDQPLADTTTVLYDLPFGRGKRFGDFSNKLVNGAIGNWQFTAIHTATSGLPINLTYSAGGYSASCVNLSSICGTSSYTSTSYPSYAFALTAGAASSGTLFSQRPNLNGNPVAPRSQWVKNPTSLTGYLSKTTATNPTDPSQPIGNAPRNAARTPAFSQLDLGLHKAFGLGWESTRLDFRAEAFNVLNQVNYQAPDSTRTDGSYGTISSGSNYPARQLQFAVKVLF